MIGRHPRLRWAVFLFACVVAGSLIKVTFGPSPSPLDADAAPVNGPAGGTTQAVRPAAAAADAESGREAGAGRAASEAESLSRSLTDEQHASAASDRIVPPHHVLVVTVEEYSGKLLLAALGPADFIAEPMRVDDTLYLSGHAPVPGPDAQMLAVRLLRTQLRPYRVWVQTAAAPPLVFGLTEPLTDVRQVFDGSDLVGTMDIVQPAYRFLQGDVTVTDIAADGTIILNYGDQAYTLAPEQGLRFAAVQPPAGGELIWLDEPDDDAFAELLGHYLAQDYADTVLDIYNHGFFPLNQIEPGHGPADDLFWWVP